MHAAPKCCLIPATPLAHWSDVGHLQLSVSVPCTSLLQQALGSCNCSGRHMNEACLDNAVMVGERDPKSERETLNWLAWVHPDTLHSCLQVPCTAHT